MPTGELLNQAKEGVSSTPRGTQYVPSCTHSDIHKYAVLTHVHISINYLMTPPSNMRAPVGLTVVSKNTLMSLYLLCFTQHNKTMLL